MKESEIIEFKSELTNNIAKEVVAFLNINGGTIYIGYKDDGSICGLSDVKKEFDRLSNILYDSIEPNASFLISMSIETIDKKDIIILSVLKGIDKPYYLKSYGMTNKGVFIRVGATVKPATNKLIKEMIIDSSNVTFEKNISINQNLNFLYTIKYFKNKGLNLEEKEMKFLGLKNNNKYTNLGLLLSDENPYTIKIAVYEDYEKSNFIDMKELQGSLLEIFEETITYLNLYNKKSGKIKGFRRYDIYDYPKEVLREIIVNAICHRDYSIGGSILINIYKDKIEVVSLGGLYGNLTIEDIKLGTSVSRNPMLVNIFHHLGLVDSYGSGIPRIYNSYRNSISKPLIKIAPNTFVIEVPIVSTKEEYNKVIDYMNIVGGGVKREELESVLSLKKGATVSLLNEMIENNLIFKSGRARDIIYKLK